MHKTFALALAFGGLMAAVAHPSAAGTIDFSGTRFNITPSGVFGDRCAPAITVKFAPDAFAASGTSNLGNFSYVASHCIAAPPPGSYFDGLFEWTFADGTLSGTHFGTLALTDTPGEFSVLETLTFTGGTGRYLDASGSASLTGLLRFGMFEGVPASSAEGSFTGRLTAPGIPEPATWAMLIAGFGIVGLAARRRRSTATC